MLRMTEEGVLLLEHFEQGPEGGFAATPYRCPAGKITTGYGHVILKGEEARFSQPLTQETARALLRSDIRRFESGVQGMFKVHLEEWEFDALVSFAFNLGLGALQRSTLRMKINRGETDDLEQEFLRWVYSGGKKLNGLKRRRQAEAWLFEGKNWRNGKPLAGEPKGNVVAFDWPRLQRSKMQLPS